jgi:hypothetical protein
MPLRQHQWACISSAQRSSDVIGELENDKAFLLTGKHSQDCPGAAKGNPSAEIAKLDASPGAPAEVSPEM